MRKILRKIAVGVSAVVLVAIVAKDAVMVPYAVNQTDVDDAQNDADSTQDKIDALQQKIDGISANITDLETYIKQMDALTETYTAQLVECQNKLDAKQVEIDAKKDEIDAKSAEIDQEETRLEEIKKQQDEGFEAMKLRIQYMYECGDETFLDMLFSAEDLSDLLGKAEYVNTIVSYDRNKLEELAKTGDEIQGIITQLEIDKQALEDQKTALDNEQAELISMKTELQNQQTYVDTIVNQKTAALAQLEQQQTNAEQLIADAKKELEEKQKIADQIKAQYEEQKRQAEQNGNGDQSGEKTLEKIGLAGGFTYPLPTRWIVSSEWGMRFHPVLHYNTLHDGIDLPASTGTPIYAAYAGTISIADTSNSTSGYGYHVKIDHGVGVSTLYAHMSLVAVHVGDYVTAGQVIGYVGSTGNSTGPHLHFSVFINGESKNPRDYMDFPAKR